MNHASTETFDAVRLTRVVRDDISANIAAMQVDEENRWLQATQFSDPRLRRLMDLAAQQGAAAGGARDPERRCPRQTLRRSFFALTDQVEEHPWREDHHVADSSAKQPTEMGQVPGDEMGCSNPNGGGQNRPVRVREVHVEPELHRGCLGDDGHLSEQFDESVLLSLVRQIGERFLHGVLRGDELDIDIVQRPECQQRALDAVGGREEHVGIEERAH